MANDNARKLRARMTDAERRLWSLLRGHRLAGYKFRRQHPLGPFILDFSPASNTGSRSRPMVGSIVETNMIKIGRVGSKRRDGR
jgi:hypothetical protein